MNTRARYLTFILGVLTMALSAFADEPGATNKPAATQAERIAAVTAEVNKATTRVRQIVNQRVPSVPYRENLNAANYAEWFHASASKPDYENVDIRKTQEFPYDQYPYITCNLKPDLAYVGRHCEFNSMTKIFYTDRTVPKKKLTEAEMVEINRLYRLIGRGLKDLAELQKVPPKP